MWLDHRSRTTDPSTSHLAAIRADEFDHKHYALILIALAQCPFGAGAHEIAEKSGLTQAQVCRRLPELERRGLIWPSSTTVLTPSRRSERVWIKL